MAKTPSTSPLVAGLLGRCPRCGKGALFAGFLGLRSHCDVCGLDYAKADSGDGPAVFVIFIAGFFGVALAFIARFVWYAPIWLTFALSAGASIIMILVLLRPMKSTLIALQYANKAAEGQLEE